MGSLTSGKYQFFKPAGTDYVDPVVDHSNNFAILDDKVYRAIRVEPNQTRFNPPLSNPAYTEGFRQYNIPTARLKYMNIVSGNKTWNNFTTNNNVEGWNTIPLISPYATDVIPCNILAWRYTTPAHTHVELKGLFYSTAGAMTTNLNVTFANAGAVPSPPVTTYFDIIPNITATQPGNNNTTSRIRISNVGDLQFNRAGSSVNVADNYVQLDNLVYHL